MITNKLPIDFVASDYFILLMIISFCFSAIVSYNSYPVIIKVSKLKALMQEPEKRSSHNSRTPNLGGVGIFLGIVIALTFIGSILSYNNLLCLIGALIVLFFTGLKDDLVELTPVHKVFGQVVASLCVIFITDIRIHTFFGIFDIESLPYFVSVIFTLFVFVLIINAYNLIDGVDGLAGCIAIMSSLLFGIFFFFNGNDSMLFLSLIIIGALSTFLIFNFSKHKKIFMGDTGSMVIGFLLAYQAIVFLRVPHNSTLFSAISNPPILVIAVFSFPLMDTLRVFIIRLINKKNPFSADKNHIHHNLLALGFKHWEISLIVSVFILIMAMLTYYFNDFSIHTSLLFLIVVNGVVSITPYLVLKILKKHKSNARNLKPFFLNKSLKGKRKHLQKLKKIYDIILNVFI